MKKRRDKTKWMQLGLMLAMALVCDATAWGGDLVTVESKSVVAGSHAVDIGIFLSNDSTLRAIACPLTIRSVAGNAFVTQLAMRHVDGGRLTDYLNGIVVNNGFQTFSDTACRRGVPSIYSPGFMTPPVWQDTLSHGISGPPVGVLIVRGTLFPAEPLLPPGSDGAIPSLKLVVDVADAAGAFEVDTTCTASSNHLQFVTDSRNVFAPAFAKGVITAVCPCLYQGDINQDILIDVFDVIGVIGIAFSGDADPHDIGCPITRGDVNNDGFTDVFDVIYLIATAFSGGPGPVNPCWP